MSLNLPLISVSIDSCQTYSDYRFLYETAVPNPENVIHAVYF